MILSNAIHSCQLIVLCKYGIDLSRDSSLASYVERERAVSEAAVLAVCGKKREKKVTKKSSRCQDPGLFLKGGIWNSVFGTLSTTYFVVPDLRPSRREYGIPL